MEKKNKSRIKICYAMEYILHQKLNPCTYNLNFKNEVIWKRAKNLIKNAFFAIDEQNPENSLNSATINEKNYKINEKL